jgi:hypothetical protein
VDIKCLGIFPVAQPSLSQKKWVVTHLSEAAKRGRGKLPWVDWLDWLDGVGVADCPFNLALNEELTAL